MALLAKRLKTATEIIFVLRIFSALTALTELGINAYIAYYADDYVYEDPYGDWGVNHDIPTQITFLLFASAWSLLALVYLIAAPAYLITGGQDTSHVARNARHRYAILAVDSVTTIFWLAGWIALAELIGGPTTCADFCAAIQASVAFAAFLWGLFWICWLIEVWLWWQRWKNPSAKSVEAQNTDAVSLAAA